MRNTTGWRIGRKYAMLLVIPFLMGADACHIHVPTFGTWRLLQFSEPPNFEWILTYDPMPLQFFPTLEQWRDCPNPLNPATVEAYTGFVWDFPAVDRYATPLPHGGPFAADVGFFMKDNPWYPDGPRSTIYPVLLQAGGQYYYRWNWDLVFFGPAYANCTEADINRCVPTWVHIWLGGSSQDRYVELTLIRQDGAHCTHRWQGDVFGVGLCDNKHYECRHPGSKLWPVDQP